jgi:hypothetical protein
MYLHKDENDQHISNTFDHPMRIVSNYPLLVCGYWLKVDKKSQELKLSFD